MDVRIVDLSATTGTSPLHRAAPVAKLVAFALTVASVVVQTNVLIVCGALSVLVAAAVGARLRMRAVLGLAAYPGLFALVFALAAAPDALTGALFVAKAVTAAMAAVVLVFTTPYPQVFAPLQRVVPEVVGDAMLMTYRSLFLLGQKFDDLLRAVRLRSGLSTGHPIRAARAATSALGSLVLYSFDLSQREYDVLRLRGYSGRLRTTLPPSRSRPTDIALVLGSLSILAVAATFRAAGASLTPYSWIPLAGALVALLAVVAWRSIAR